MERMERGNKTNNMEKVNETDEMPCLNAGSCQEMAFRCRFAPELRSSDNLLEGALRLDSVRQSSTHDEDDLLRPQGLPVGCTQV